MPLLAPSTYPLQESGRGESMLNMVDALLELGGDLGKVNSVGNDFVAVAGRSLPFLPA